MPRLLIVESDVNSAGHLANVLHGYGFRTEVATSRSEAVGRAKAVDLALLDLSFRDGDSLDLLSHLSERVALVVISEHTGEADRVAALELGADDYVTKPFASRELVARCRSVLRRARRAWPHTVVRTGDLHVDVDRYEARRGGRPLVLTTKELELLVALARQPGVLVRREELAREIWGNVSLSVNGSLDVHMSSLRRKLGDSPQRPRYIQTVHGLGFRLLPGSDPIGGMAS